MISWLGDSFRFGWAPPSFDSSTLPRNAVEYGFRREGHQAFVRISSHQPWTWFAPEPLDNETVAHPSRLGL